MKRNFLLFALFAVLWAAGCSDDDPVVTPEPQPEPQPQPAPTLALDHSEVNVPTEGGVFSLTYKLENPIENEAVNALCEAEWVAEISTAEAGVISFKVAQNEVAEPREAQVKVTYADLKPRFFSILQAAGAEPEKPVEPAPFEVEFTNITETSFTTTMLPADKEMSYINFVNTKSYCDTMDDAALFDDDMRYLNNLAASWKLPFEEMLMEYAMEGDIVEQPMTGLEPGTEYTFYVYGIDLKTHERITEIIRKDVRTNPVNMVDAHFDFDIKLDGVVADITTTPRDNFDGVYYTSVNYGLPESTPHADLVSSLKSYFKGLIAAWQNQGLSMNEIFDRMCHTGVFQKTYELLPETESFVTAFAVDREGQICSDVSVKFFTTGKVEQSTNEIALSVTDIKDRTAMLHITTTNDDPYVYVICPTADLDGISNEELVSYLLSYYLPQRAQGTQDIELTTLLPETAYTIHAFGYDHDAVTTALQRLDFSTTVAEAAADISITIDYSKFYNSMEVAKLDPWFDMYANDFMCFLPITFEVTPADCELFWNVYDPAIFDRGSITEDSVIRALTNGGAMTEMQSVMPLPYGMYVTICAVARNAEGKLSKLYRGPDVMLDETKVSDPSEFVRDFPGSSEPIKSARPAGTSSGSVKTAAKVAYRTLNAVRHEPAQKIEAQETVVPARLSLRR